MKRIAIANRKGGVAKTTTAVHLAEGLTRLHKRVLLIDTDPQGHCSKFFDTRPEYHIEDVLEDKPGEPTEVREGLYFLPSAARLALVAPVKLNRAYNPQLILSEKLERFTGYDFVIVDTSPSYSALSVNVFFYVDEIMVPVSMEVLAADGFQQLQTELQEMQSAGAAPVRYIVPTMVDGRKGLSQDMVDALHRHFHAQVTRGIRYSAKFSELAQEQKTIYHVDRHGKGSVDYADLTVRVFDGA